MLASKPNHRNKKRPETLKKSDTMSWKLVGEDVTHSVRKVEA